jgi:hypothetical protein
MSIDNGSYACSILEVQRKYPPDDANAPDEKCLKALHIPTEHVITQYCRVCEALLHSSQKWAFRGLFRSKKALCNGKVNAVQWKGSSVQWKASRG